MCSGVTKVETERERSSSSYRRQAEEEEEGGGGVDDDRKTVSLQPQHRSAALHTNSSSNRTGRTDRQRTTTHACNNTSSTTPCTPNQSVSLTVALSFSPKTEHHTSVRSHRHCSQNRSSRTKTHTAIFVRCQNKKDGLIFMFLILLFLSLSFFFGSLGSFSWTYEGYFGKKEWKHKCCSSKFKGRGKKTKRLKLYRYFGKWREKRKKNQLLDCFMLFLFFS
jgi:hypothetical protein